jgi:hypothetical protein
VDAERRKGDRPRLVRRHQDRDAQHQQDRDLGDHAATQQTATELDAASAAAKDDDRERHGIDPPSDIGSAVQPDEVIEEEAEQAVQRDSDACVGRQRDQRTRHPESRAKARLDIGIEPAGAQHETAHRGEAGGEHQVKTAHEQEGDRHARPVAKLEGGRRNAHHGRERRCRGDDEEDDVGSAERILAQGIGSAVIGCHAPTNSLRPSATPEIPIDFRCL